MNGLEGLMMEFEYDVQFILGKLRENRAAHAKDFEETMEEFKNSRRDKFIDQKAVIMANLAKVEKSLQQGEDVEISDVLDDVDFNMVKPVNYLHHYDDMIGQLDMTSQTKLSLSSAVYKQLVQDDWSWKSNFNFTKSLYLVK